MRNCSPFRECIANELNVEGSAALEAEHLRRRGEAIVALLHCLEKLKRLRGAYSRYGGIPAKDY